MNLKIQNIKTLYTAIALLGCAPIITNAQNINQRKHSELMDFINLISPNSETNITFDTSSQAAISYGKTNILGKTYYLPTAKYEFASYNSDHTFCKPNIAISTKHVEASLPSGYYVRGKHWTFEGGSDFIGIRQPFNPSEFNDTSKAEENIPLGEIYSNINLGTYYQSNMVKLRVRAEEGIRGYHRKNADKVSPPYVELYTAVKAFLNLTPFKNKKISLNVEGIYDTKKDFQYNTGIGYKF